MALSLVQPHDPTTDLGTDILCLFDGPYVIQGGRRFDVPEGSKRLLVFVTLHGGRVNRRHAAGTLWPYGDDDRAAGNLRSALWRLKGAGIAVLHADKISLQLAPGLVVDVTELTRWADRVIEDRTRPSDIGLVQLSRAAVDLLPGWYEDWVVFERERIRQRLLHALESLSRRLVKLARFADAVEVAMTAVSLDPLRESAQRVLIEAHVAEGNQVEARRAFTAYERLVGCELGITPSDELASVMGATPSLPGPRPAPTIGHRPGGLVS